MGKQERKRRLKRRLFKKRRQEKRKLLKTMEQNLKKAYAVCAELDKHSAPPTREQLDQRYCSSPTS